MNKAEFREFKEKLLELFAEAAPKLAARFKGVTGSGSAPASPKVSSG